MLTYRDPDESKSLPRFANTDNLSEEDASHPALSVGPKAGMSADDIVVKTESDDNVNFIVAGNANAKDPFISVLEAAIAALEERFSWPPRFIECTQHCRFAASTSLPSKLFFFDLHIRLLSAAQIFWVASYPQVRSPRRRIANPKKNMPLAYDH